MADKAVVTQTTLDAIGQAIIDKGGATEPMTPAQMPAAIQSIPSGGEPGLDPIAYDPVKGALGTAWKVLIPYDNFEYKVKNLKLAYGISSTTIDWGDGITESIGNVIDKVHVYATQGEYTITVPNELSKVCLTGYNGFVGNNVANCIREIISIGTRVSDVVELANHCVNLEMSCGLPPACKTLYCTFYGCASLKRFVEIPESCVNAGYTFCECYSACGKLPELPDGITNIDFIFNKCKNATGDVPIIPSSCNSANNSFSECSSLGGVIKGLFSTGNCSSMFSGCYSLRGTIPSLHDGIKSCNNMFKECRNLTGEIPAIPDGVTNMAQMFYNCSRLTGDIPAIPSSVTDLTYSFFGCSSIDGVAVSIPKKAISYGGILSGCSNLKSIQDDIDITLGTNIIQFFNGCICLRRIPGQMQVDDSFDFSECTGITDKDSVAEFSGGLIIGGFAYNLNACTKTGKTITFGTHIKSLFSADEWTAIKTALTAKNWGCSPA